MHKTPFVLSGPPGCGKRYLLHQALEGKHVAKYDLAAIPNNNGTTQDFLEYAVNTYGGGFCITKTGLLEKPLLIIYGAEHLTEEGAKCISSKHKHVVVVCSTYAGALRALKNTLWVNRLIDMENAELYPKAVSTAYQCKCSETSPQFKWRYAASRNTGQIRIP